MILVTYTILVTDVKLPEINTALMQKIGYCLMHKKYTSYLVYFVFADKTHTDLSYHEANEQVEVSCALYQ